MLFAKSISEGAAMKYGTTKLVFAVCGLLLHGTVGLAQRVPSAVTADPARDTAFPPRSVVVHIPSGDAIINGIVYTASGAGPHSTLVLFHGLPGNERNSDLAQAVRRAGWNVVLVNYRGSWGSGGKFRFANTLEDAKSTLAYIRNAKNAGELGVDTSRIVIAGHSMGGWVAAETLADDPGVLGAILISPGDFGATGVEGRAHHDAVAGRMNAARETLVDVTGDSMADELTAHADAWSFSTLAPRLAGRRLMILYSEDFAKKYATTLINAMKAVPGSRTESAYTVTDHYWSDARISLESQVIEWLTKTFPQS
jgi:pimeloyl-ACP methyl ester carboxylesterase